MHWALGAERKLVFVNDSTPIPYQLDLIEVHRKGVITSFILGSNYFSDSIGQTNVFHDNALDIWEDLK